MPIEEGIFRNSAGDEIFVRLRYPEATATHNIEGPLNEIVHEIFSSAHPSAIKLGDGSCRALAWTDARRRIELNEKHTHGFGLDRKRFDGLLDECAKTNDFAPD